MKKNLLLFISLAVCLFLLSACTAKESSSVSVEAAPGHTTGGNPGANTPSAASQSSSVPASGQSASSDTVVASLPPASTNDIKTLRGIIADAATGHYFVELEDGLTLSIPFAEADTSKLKESRPGAEVIVEYTGVLDGANTSGITVLAIYNP